MLIKVYLQNNGDLEKIVKDIESVTFMDVTIKSKKDSILSIENHAYDDHEEIMGALSHLAFNYNVEFSVELGMKFHIDDDGTVDFKDYL